MMYVYVVNILRLFNLYRILCVMFVFFQAEDGIRDLVRSRGLGDVYKRQGQSIAKVVYQSDTISLFLPRNTIQPNQCMASENFASLKYVCLLYTSDAADERSSVDLGGRRIIKKKKS